MTSKGWVILRSGFEYNDEIYSVSEGGEPMHVYKDKAKADEALVTAYHEFFEDGVHFNEYFYDLDDILRDRIPEFVEKWNKIVPNDYKIPVSNPPREEDYHRVEPHIGAGITLDQTKEIMKLFHLKFFYIEEIDIDE